MLMLLVTEHHPQNQTLNSIDLQFSFQNNIFYMTKRTHIHYLQKRLWYKQLRDFIYAQLFLGSTKLQFYSRSYAALFDTTTALPMIKIIAHYNYNQYNYSKHTFTVVVVVVRINIFVI